MKKIIIAPVDTTQQAVEICDAFFGFAQMCVSPAREAGESTPRTHPAFRACRYQAIARQAIRTASLSIMDNGAYEEDSLSIHRLKEIRELMKPTYMVLPDSTESVEKSNAILMASLVQIKDKDGWMAVPRGRDLPEYLARVRDCIHQGVVAFGISGLLMPADTTRAEIARTVKALWPGVYIHALGVTRPSDVEELEASESVDSVDSAKFFYEPAYKLKKRPDDYFDREPSESELELVKEAYRER